MTMPPKLVGMAMNIGRPNKTGVVEGRPLRRNERKREATSCESLGNDYRSGKAEVERWVGYFAFVATPRSAEELRGFLENSTDRIAKDVYWYLKMHRDEGLKEKLTDSEFFCRQFRAIFRHGVGLVKTPPDNNEAIRRGLADTVGRITVKE